MPSPQCPRCGRENESSFAFCQGCGQELLQSSPGGERHCPGCGWKIEPTFRFCGHCGLPAAETASPPAAEDQPPVLQRSTRIAPPSPGPSERSQAPAPSLPQQPPVAGSWRGVRLVPVRHDGLPGTAHALGSEGAVCGRMQGQLRFADDATVSPEHARFTILGEAVVVEDLGSVNGTFLRVRSPRPLASGDEVRLGRQLLRVETISRPVEGSARPWGSADTGYRARLTQLLEGGGAGEVFPLRQGENAIGREVGQVCFPSDRYVSARHARIDVSDTGMVLTDVGSSNGTFVRITVPTQVVAGDQVLLGMRLLRVDG
jgi:pSer/pThr/pTyr-binding forkhead associated (FHA) protein